MTRITGSEHVLLLLRERLARGGRAQAGAKGTAGAARSDPRPLERLRAMAGLAMLGEDERRRAVVHALLADELGDGVANDAEFRAVLDDVMRIIAAMPGGAELVDRATAVLGEG